MIPGYWMYETSGVLEPVVKAYLNDQFLDQKQIAIMRAYLRQWIELGSWAPTPGIEQLRRGLDGLTSRQAIDDWLERALEEGIDPL